MNKKMASLSLVFGVLLLISGIKTYAQESSLDTKVSYQFIAVEGDEGRFREDRYITDDHTLGLEKYIYSTDSGDYSFDLDLHGIYDYDYGLNFDLTKQDAYYIKFNSRQLRRYYDGSNESWDPSLYSLTDEFADREDGHMYVDRLNADFEVGFSMDNIPDISFGWNRWTRDGEETLLRGSQTTAAGLASIRSLAAYSEVQGISDTFFVKLAETFADKYNFSLKQELESYRDNQRIIFPRYASGVLDQFRTFEDEPSFTEALTHFAFNSFLSKKTYVTANYLYQDLHNTTLRSSVRPGESNPNHFINPDVNNRRKANIANLGIVFLDGPIKNLRWGVNFRAEKAITKAEGQGLASGTTLRISESEQAEESYGESLSLTYTGIKKTILSYILELEQRDLNWNEYADSASYELPSNFGGPSTLERETDVTYNDVISTFKLTTRPTNKCKVSFKYKKAVKRRGYTDLRDNSESFYPGYMGSSREDSDQYSLRLTNKLHGSWIAGLEFLFEEDELGYAMQNGVDGQKIMRNRLSANLTGNPTEKLTLNIMAMGEDFELDTPGSGASTNPTYAEGETAFDYDADVYLVSVSGNYRFNDKTSGYLTLQHTETTGTISNALTELWLGAKRELKDDNTLEARLELFDFNDESGGGFDNYKGIGLYLAYDKQF